ncbi:hypothetical protein J2Y69_002649 [Microbacterium resistens]|uniref:Uncharacterized protein n=1 Tax=Microbacterium resistens TaxID=156977 RepID=A0ABU1SEM6_9MICO|nr:hypothetical protein [Microbacterium resistens]MDR6868041.1 hypothetical protein [Microbacterium resistens]
MRRRDERRTVPGLLLAGAAIALLLTGCAGGAGGPGGASSAHPGATGSGSPHPTQSEDALALGDLDDDFDFDFDFDDFDDDFDLDDDDDFDLDDLDDLGLGPDDLIGFDDADDLADFLHDARRASLPENASSSCVAVQPVLDDLAAGGFDLGVDEVAGATSDNGGGYFLAVDLEDSRIAVLYTESSPTSPSFSGTLFAVNDVALGASNFASAATLGLGDLSANGGASRAPRCL